mmetsp:Transcript_53938/g.97306  ORF Transcript_53938/g.97306 Transcript_53938/m.97306 type:complete len:122 (+) Transcript_53938:42-407(+)
MQGRSSAPGQPGQGTAALAGSAAGPALTRRCTKFPSAFRQRLEDREPHRVTDAFELERRFMLYPAQRHLGVTDGVVIVPDRGRACVAEEVGRQATAALMAENARAIRALPDDHVAWAKGAD